MDIDADIHFQRRAWAAQRIGWFFFAVLIIAAMLGFFGGGSLSRVSGQASGLKIEYERFARFQQPTKLRITLPTGADTTQVELSRRYFDSVQIEQITPEPSAVESADEVLIYSPISVRQRFLTRKSSAPPLPPVHSFGSRGHGGRRNPVGLSRA